MTIEVNQKILSKAISKMWKDCGFHSMPENQLTLSILRSAMQIAYCKGRMDGLNNITKGKNHN